MRANPRGSTRRKDGLYWGVFRSRRRVFFRNVAAGAYPGPSLRRDPGEEFGLGRKDRQGGGVFSTGRNPVWPEIEPLEYPTPSLRPALSENSLENRPSRGRDEGPSPGVDEAKRQGFWGVSRSHRRFFFLEGVASGAYPGPSLRRDPGEEFGPGRKDRQGGGVFDGPESGLTGNRASRVSDPVTSAHP